MNKTSTYTLCYLLLLSSFSLHAQISVSGNIACENGDPIIGAIVESSLDSVTTITDAYGNYQFNSVSPFTSISATYDEMNTICINAYDIHRIQKHLLDVEAIDNPYRLVAADFNESNSVTGFDMVMVTRSILDVPLPGEQKVWTIVNADFEFTNPNNPFPTEVEFHNIITGELDVVDANFIGVKKGNTSIDCCFPTPPDEMWELAYETLLTSTGELVVRLKSSNFIDIVAFQFEIAFDEEVLQFVEAESSNLSNFNTSNYILISPSNLAFSWFSSELYGITLPEDDIILEMTFELVDPNIVPSEIFQFVTNRIEAEAYRSDGSSIGTPPGTITGLNETLSDKIMLCNNPNPFSKESVIHFNIVHSEALILEIFDVNGQSIFKEQKHYESGSHYVSIGSTICTHPGIYFYRISSNDFQVTKRMVKR